MSIVRTTLATAALAAALAPATASADPIPDPPPVHTFCSVYWQPVPIFSDDVPVTPSIPRLAC